ncbi:MAG: asparagine synthase (glutamine-hydrolyzing) [Thermomicrobia bacterium]|nr:asparagine synthase (glutamine-hydrolyzing) [Thermomicrobia bacterium]
MCGICGVFHPGSSVERCTITAMCDSLRHRGPDDDGIYVHGPVGLGARRLSIIDLAGGHQPLCNETGSIWAVHNGEIYNYQDLRADLLQRGHHLATQSDTEVLVHLYEEYGDDFVQRLHGMFVFAIWDAPRQRLLLARDRLGVKPLVYMLHEGRLLWGSEIKAILTAGVPRRVDPAALHDYLSFDYVPGPRTMFAGIRKLPAGHLLIWDGDLQVRPYWDVPGKQQEVSRNREELRAHLRGLLEDAVRETMVSDVPVGAFLSGGLDSSVIVALMSRVAQGPVRTFSVGFRERSYNELPYARMVAERYGTDHHEVIVEPELGPQGAALRGTRPVRSDHGACLLARYLYRGDEGAPLRRR